ncbi:putative hspc200 [Schistosoma mansoni]|nr:putative hspc200 [Schistosoma mansoni]|eukprot:XP_018655494.1 putative hspc200 [Schistosoma mansoni]
MRRNPKAQIRAKYGNIMLYLKTDRIQQRMTENSHSCTNHTALYQSTHQDLSEMDFERGILGASTRGDIDRVRKLLNKHINVNIPDSYGYTALHYAARNNHEDVCKVLLEAGADSFAKTKNDGATPAHRAAYAGHLGILKLLVGKGGAPLLESRDNCGRNCLHHAYRGKHKNIIDWLLESYPNLSSTRDNNGLLPDFVGQSANEMHCHELNV